MAKISWKQLLAAAPLIAAIAALVAAVLGQDGISGLIGRGNSEPPDEIVELQPNPDISEGTTRTQNISTKFSCQNLDGKLSTVVSKNQVEPPVAIIHWDLNNNYFGDEYTPELRCNIVSQRFQTLYEKDRLAFLTVGVSDWETSFGIPIICSVSQTGDSCTEANLLITLENRDDPNNVLEQLIAVRNDPISNQAMLRTGKTSPTFEDGLRLYYDIRELFSEPLF